MNKEIEQMVDDFESDRAEALARCARAAAVCNSYARLLRKATEELSRAAKEFNAMVKKGQTND